MFLSAAELVIAFYYSVLLLPILLSLLDIHGFKVICSEPLNLNLSHLFKLRLVLRPLFNSECKLDCYVLNANAEKRVFCL